MRIAIISDVHEDYQSLQKILRRISLKGYDKLICLGDVTGFSPSFYKYGRTRNAEACLTLARERCDVVIPGNHDLAAARRIPLHSATFEFPSGWYGLEPGQRDRLSGGMIWQHEDDLDPGFGPGNIHYLETLPEFAVLEAPGYRILLSHYAYPNLSGFTRGFYTWEQEFRQHFEFMRRHDCSVSFIGHAHPRGFYMVMPGQFRHFSFRWRSSVNFPSIIGVPPVTRHRNRRGFCIFDAVGRIVRIY